MISASSNYSFFADVRGNAFSCGSRHPDDEVEVEGALAVHQVIDGGYLKITCQIFEIPALFVKIAQKNVKIAKNKRPIGCKDGRLLASPG